MERQILETGVRRWFGEDWIKLQDEIYKALEEGILGNLDDCILSGMEVSPNASNYDVAPGICYVGGKIAIYEGATNITLPISLKLKETPAGDRLYLDGSTKPTRTHYTAATDGTLGGNLEISSTNDPRIQIPAVNSNGELIGVVKSDSILEDDTNTLATSKAAFELTQVAAVLSSRIANLEALQDVRCVAKQVAPGELPLAETTINLQLFRASDNTDVIDLDEVNNKFLLKTEGIHVISYEGSWVNEDGSNRDIFIRIRDEGGVLIDERKVLITGSGGGDDGNANVTHSVILDISTPTKEISISAEASGDQVEQQFFKATASKMSSLSGGIPDLDPSSNVETDAAGSLIAVSKETGHNLPKSDSPTLNDSNTLATSKAVRDATRGSNTTQVQIGDNAEASGSNSTAVGYQAEASGGNSTAVGERTVANDNSCTALGYRAESTGVQSTAVGYQAASSGGNSTAVGDSATAIGGGTSALGRSAAATGTFSTALGRNTTATGNTSTAVGSFAAVSRDSSTALGGDSVASGSNSTAVGSNANVSASNTMVLGTSSTTVLLGDGTTVISDKRDKIDIADNDLGLDFVKQIKTRKWRGNNRDQYWIKEKVKEKREGAAEAEEIEVFKTDEKGERVYDAEEHAKGSKAGKRWHRGIISQEMLELIDPMEFSGVKDTEVNNPDINNQQMGFSYNQLIAPMIKAIQELSAKVEEQQTQIEQLA